MRPPRSSSNGHGPGQLPPGSICSLLGLFAAHPSIWFAVFMLVFNPCTSASATLFTCLSFSILSRCPNHFILALLSFKDTGGWESISLMSAFLTKWSHLTPTLLLNIPISKTSCFLSSVIVSAYAVAPYRSTGSTMAQNIFILISRLISLLLHILYLGIPNALVAAALLFPMSFVNFPSLEIALPR